MNKPLPTLAVNDNVVLRLEDGSMQSALLTRFSVKNGSHRYAHFKWKTGPKPGDVKDCEIHSAKWAEKVLAVFPAGALMTKKHFIAIAEMFKTQLETLRNTTSLSPNDAQFAVGVIKITINGFVSVAQQDNPRFDAALFRAACGL